MARIPTEELERLETLAMRVLRRVEPKMLIIDEAHDLLAGSYREQRCALNLLKGLANDLKIPVIAVGTEDARHAIQTDAQVASRFDPLHTCPVEGVGCLSQLRGRLRQAITSAQSVRVWPTRNGSIAARP
jgi:ATP-dependent Clp protease ATP-binding subunit ClpA